MLGLLITFFDYFCNPNQVLVIWKGQVENRQGIAWLQCQVMSKMQTKTKNEWIRRYWSSPSWACWRFSHRLIIRHLPIAELVIRLRLSCLAIVTMICHPWNSIAARRSFSRSGHRMMPNPALTTCVMIGCHVRQEQATPMCRSIWTAARAFSTR